MERGRRQAKRGARHVEESEAIDDGAASRISRRPAIANARSRGKCRARRREHQQGGARYADLDDGDADEGRKPHDGRNQRDFERVPLSADSRCARMRAVTSPGMPLVAEVARYM